MSIALSGYCNDCEIEADIDIDLETGNPFCIGCQSSNVIVDEADLDDDDESFDDEDDESFFGHTSEDDSISGIDDEDYEDED